MNVENRIDFRDINLECAVCTETYDDPYLIKCGHVFCKACIDSLQKTVCPLCRNQFNKVTDLVQNKHLAGVIEGIQNNAAKIFPAPQEAPQPVPLNPIRDVPRQHYDCVPIDYHIDFRIFTDFINSLDEVPPSNGGLIQDLRLYSKLFFAVKKNNEMEYLIIGKRNKFEPNLLKLLSLHSKARNFPDEKIVEVLTEFFTPASHEIHSVKYDKIAFKITQDNFKFLDLFVQACRAANKSLEVTQSNGKSLLLTVNLKEVFSEKCVPKGSYQEIFDRIRAALLLINQDEDDVFLKDSNQIRQFVYQRNEQDELCGYLILSRRKRRELFHGTVIQEIKTLKDHQHYLPSLIRKAMTSINISLKYSYDSTHKVYVFIAEEDKVLLDAFQNAIAMLSKETDLFYKFGFKKKMMAGALKYKLTVSKNDYF